MLSYVKRKGIISKILGGSQNDQKDQTAKLWLNQELKQQN
jgi:hypothetical protein